MAPSSRTYFCPQCGARRSHPVPGVAGQHVCESCGTRFAVGSDNLERAAAAPPLSKLPLLQGKYRNAVIAGVLALGAAGLLLPLLFGQHKSQRSEAVVQSKGRADMSALYEAGGKFSRVDVYKHRTEQNEDEYRIEVSDMQNGAALSPAQIFRFPWLQNGGEFKSFSDGHLYLQLKEAAVLRFDPGAQQFVDLRPMLVAQFPRELGAGLAKIRFAYRDRPDSFEVTANDGRKYYVYWVAGQILDAEVASKADEQRAAQASQTRKHYRYVQLPRGHSLESSYLLVQYWSKHDSGQPEHLPYFELKPRPDPKEAGRWDRDVGGGYMVSAYAVDQGLTRLEVIDATPRFDATVLAENATRLLLAYSATPEQSKGRMRQLLDKQNNQIVWSRDVAQIPLLARERGGVYVRAQGLPSGFFMQGSSLEPGYLMDNQGELVQEFAWR